VVDKCRHIEANSDDSYTINQWHCCEKFIQGEVGLVKELNKEIKLFTKPKPSKPFDQVVPLTLLFCSKQSSRSCLTMTMIA